MTGFLSVKNFAAHQHYKDRRPPWIKLHAAILEDYAFSCLPDASKAHLLLIGLLASKLDNRIPNDATWIGRQIGASEPVDLQVLIASGFLLVEQDDSELISQRLQDAMPETEGETETEKRKPLAEQKFAEVWELYPKRAGGNSKQEAHNAFKARLRSGESADAMVEGTRRYAAFCTATGKIYTEFVKQGRTFFGPARHYLETWEIPATNGSSPLTADAERVWGVLVASGIHHMTTPAQLDQALATLLADGVIRGAPEFKTMLRRFDIKFLRKAENPAAIRHIAQHLNGSVSKVLA